MATRLPSEEDLGQSPTMNSGRPIASIDYSPIGEGAMAMGKAVSGVGDNLARVAQVLNRKAEKEKAENDYSNNLTADADFKVAQAKLDTAASELNDPEAINAHKATYQSALDAAAQKIPDARQRADFLTKNSVAVANSQARLDGKVQRIGLDRDLATLDTELYEMKQGALAEKDPALANTKIEAANARLDQFAAQGKITQVQAVTMKRAWAQDYAEKFVTSRYSADEQVGILKGQVDPADKDAVLDRIGGVESGNRDNAANPMSSARGRFQFIEGTWLNYIKRYRPDLAAGKTDGAILGMRGDGALQREMASKMIDNSAASLKANGLPVTAGTLYLAHFAGIGDKEKGTGAIGLLQVDPSTPVDQIFSPKAINANRSILAGKTAGQVIAWADRKMGGDKTAIEVSKYIPAERREMLARSAQKTVAAEEQQNALVTREEAVTVTTLMKRDEAQVAANGTPIQDLTPERVEAAHGPEAKQEFMERREAASDYHGATKSWARMTPDEIEASIERLNPQQYEGTGKWNLRQEYFSKAQSAAAEALEQRRNDPAGAVASDPNVQKVVAEFEKTGAGGKRPQDFQNVVQARLQAQELIGVPDYMRRVATQSEVDHYASVLRPMAKGQIEAMEKTQADVINSAVAEIFDKYGDEHAQQVISAVMSKVTLSKEAGEVASEVIKNVRSNPYGPVIPERERKKLQVLQTTQMIEQATQTTARDRVDDADMADKGRPTTRGALSTFARARRDDPPPAVEAPAAAAKPAEAPKTQAAKLRETFDKTMKDPDVNIPKLVKEVGVEAAKRILGAQYEAHLFRMKQQGQ